MAAAINILRVSKTPEIRTAQVDAASNGLTKFDCSAPCVRGHSAKRYTRTGQCVQCKAEISARYSDQNREAVSERHRKWYAENRDRASELQKQWRRKHIDLVNVQQCRYRETNGDRLNAAKKRAYWENPEKFRAASREYSRTHKEQRRVA